LSPRQRNFSSHAGTVPKKLNFDIGDSPSALPVILTLGGLARKGGDQIGQPRIEPGGHRDSLRGLGGGRCDQGLGLAAANNPAARKAAATRAACSGPHLENGRQ